MMMRHFTSVAVSLLLASVCVAAEVQKAGAALEIGTARLMGAEQQWGGYVGPASAIFSLACVLHELLVGKPPFGSDVHPGIPRSVTRTLRKALAS